MIMRIDESSIEKSNALELVWKFLKSLKHLYILMRILGNAKQLKKANKRK